MGVHNSLQGRPGEWIGLTDAQVKELIEVTGFCLTCLFHKTMTTYGEAGKYVPKSVLRSMQVYYEMPGLGYGFGWEEGCILCYGLGTLSGCISCTHDKVDRSWHEIYLHRGHVISHGVGILSG